MYCKFWFKHWLVHELSGPWLYWLRVGLSANRLVTFRPSATSNFILMTTSILPSFPGRLWHFKFFNGHCQCVDLYSASTGNTLMCLGVLVPCEHFSRRLKVSSTSFGLQIGSGRMFQADGPAMAKARGRPYVFSRWRDTCSRFCSVERRWLWLDSGKQWTARCWGAQPFRHQWTMTTSLNRVSE